MGTSKALLRKSNPLRSDAGWQFLLIEGILALAVGLYILLAETRAQRDIVFLIGVFLLLNGLGHAIAGLRSRDVNDADARYLLIRAGIGIITGLIVVINRFAEFMGLDPARIIAGLGLIGMGIVTVLGTAAVRDDRGVQAGAIAGGVLLALWGAVILYYVANDEFATDWLGWTALIVGAGLCAFALYRRRSEGTLARQP